MSVLPPIILTPADADWPARLTERLGDAAPSALHAIGPVSLLAEHKTALFCSIRTPGDAILRALDTARRLRDEGATVISGFHSPIEAECLRILLRGKQPILVCLGRAMCPGAARAGMRIPSACRAAFDAGRVLFLSPFAESPKRVTKASAARRNEVVAALADAVFLAHVAPGGQTAGMAELLKRWGVPVLPAE